MVDARVPSGRFLLRIPPDLHRGLRERAAGAGSSLNEFCRAALEAAVNGRAHATTSSGTAAAEAVVAGFGVQVEAVVLFGSGARGDAGTWSDVDLLIVVATEVPITRALYRTWDRSVAAAAAIRALGPSVNPHFAHLPVADAGTGGGGGSLWLEAGAARHRPVAADLGRSPAGSGARGSGWPRARSGAATRMASPTGRIRTAMHNPDLAADYLRRAGSRLKALAVLMDEESWADVVRESQEVVEICLKALLRSARIEVPRIHDVSGVLEDKPRPLAGRRTAALGRARPYLAGTAPRP